MYRLLLFVLFVFEPPQDRRAALVICCDVYESLPEFAQRQQGAGFQTEPRMIAETLA